MHPRSPSRAPFEAQAKPPAGAGMSLTEVARLVGGEAIAADSVEISGVAALREARAGEIAPFFDARLEVQAAASRAAALLAPTRLGGLVKRLARPAVVCEEPRRALGMLLRRFDRPARRRRGIHASAVVDGTSRIHPSAYVGPFCVVEARSWVGPRCQLDGHCHVGPDVILQEDCVVGAHVSIGAGAIVGARTRLGPGSVVGAEGFGFWREGESWQRMASTGRVELGPDVEVGANTCVDRATLGRTRVGRGSKVDNLVQIGHNVEVGEHVLLCAQVGLAGSSKVGSEAVLGGQVGVADHRLVGERARVGAGAGVASDLREGSTASGYPAIDHQRWLRASVLFSRLDELNRRVRQLERRVEELTKGGPDRPSGP